MKKSDVTVVIRAKKLLAKADDSYVEIHAWEFRDDREAHDDDLVEFYYQKAAKAFEKSIAILNKQFGEVAKRAGDENSAIPRCGVVEYAVWELAKRRLYVAWLHEDRELPIALILGTLTIRHVAKQVRKSMPSRKRALSTKKTKSANRKSR